jgi:hypothetical protein
VAEKPTADQVFAFVNEHIAGLKLTDWQESYVRQVYAVPPSPDPAGVVHVITTLGPTEELAHHTLAELYDQLQWLPDDVWDVADEAPSPPPPRADYYRARGRRFDFRDED